MWDLIPPSPPQAHCQAPVSKAGHWASWPRGRLLSGYSLLTCSGRVSPAGPLSARCWASSRFPALVPSTTPLLLGDSRGPLQPGASPARSGTEITMPRAEAALEWGGDRQLHRSAPSQQGGGVHVPADPRQPGAPLRGGQAPAAGSRLQHGRQQPPCELRPSQLAGPPLREHSALGSLEDWLAVLLMQGNQ